MSDFLKGLLVWAGLIAVGLLLLAAFYWHQHWIAVHTGTYITPGQYSVYYNFLSGFGSDLGELTLITAALDILRHRNCHTKGCWRFGKPVEGTPYLACHKHHPDHHGNRRNVPLAVIHEAHSRRRIGGSGGGNGAEQ